MVRPTRAQQIPNLQEAIKDTAWKQIAETGAAALSLRAIARALKITAPAIYNYFPSRDDLVTALIIDAYTSLGDSQIAARDALPVEALEDRLQATGLAYRRWAITHPQWYQLIFGTPIPGYQAPMEQVRPFAARSLSVLVSVVEGLRLAGRLKVHSLPRISRKDKTQFEVWKKSGGEAGTLSLSVAILIWCRVHGIVSLEIAGDVPPFGADGDALYLYELESIRRQFVEERA
jgi:AcrR family transcriptional regulator